MAGGNMVRGAELAGQGIRRVTADQMGMLSGLINCMAMTDIFEANDVKTRCHEQYLRLASRRIIFLPLGRKTPRKAV